MHSAWCSPPTLEADGGRSSAVIVLRPEAEPDGGLSLISDGRTFGDPGFHFTVDVGEGRAWVRWVRAMKERLTLRSRGEALTASHRFVIFGLDFLELRYDIAPGSGSR